MSDQISKQRCRANFVPGTFVISIVLLVVVIRGCPFQSFLAPQDNSFPVRANSPLKRKSALIDRKPAQGHHFGNPTRKARALHAKSESSNEAAAGAAIGLSAVALEKQKSDAVRTLGLCILSAIAFCGYIYVSSGALDATTWLSCYVLEYSLSIDNLFVFILIFKYFKVPAKLQGRVLNFGILGAILFRFIFVFLGALVLQQLDFLILGFSAILLYASYQGITKGDDDDDDDDENLDDNFIVQGLQNFFDVSSRFDGENFFTKVGDKTLITPLLLCLLTIEFSDIVFATDSVPAVLGTTKNQFIAYSSNIFAVLGLRSLFFLLQEAIVSFQYLESAVNYVLGFIGLKIILDFFGVIQIDVAVSLAIVLGTLLTGIIASINDMSQENDSEDSPKNGNSTD